jgi:translation initiation factor IF-3
MRPGTDDHDFERKVKDALKFLGNGDKVKVTLRFRGREMAHQNLGREMLEKVVDEIEGIGKIESMPKMEGRQMVMMINPVK